MMNIQTYAAGLLIGFFMIAACDNPPSKQFNENKSEKKKEKTVTKEKKRKIAVLTGEGFQDAEAFMPIGYLTNRGFEITVIGEKPGEVKAYNSEFTIQIEKSVTEVSPDEFEALILPGGKAPAELRENEDVVAFAREFFNSGKPTAAICHGPQVLIRAGVMEGKNATAVKSVKEELEAAGVQYFDESVVVDENLITSRVPDDLNDFSSTIHGRLK